MSNPAVLIDSWKSGTSGLSLITEASEVAKKQVSPKAIGVLEGPCSEFDVYTENDNKYTKRLWENVVSSDYFKTALENKVLFGEIDHPPERIEPWAQRAAINMTSYKIDEKNNMLYGTFDILPTEQGKIIKALCEYGSKLGVSSRGVGDLMPDENGKNVVNEDNYNFICFDVVVQPAAKKARQNFKSLGEAKKYAVALDSTLLESIQKAQTEDDLIFMENLLTRVDFDTKENIKQKIEEKRTELREHQKTIKSAELIQEDLEKAYKENAQLKEQIKANKNIEVIAEVKKLESQVNNINTSIKSLKDSQVSQLLRENKSLKTKLTKTEQSIHELTSKLSQYKFGYNKKTGMISELKEAVDYSAKFVAKCKSTLESIVHENKTLLESKNSLSNRLRSLNESISQNNQIAEEFKLAYLQQMELQKDLDLTSVRAKVLESRSVQEADQAIETETRRILNEARRSKPKLDSVILKENLDRSSEEHNTVIQNYINSRQGGKL